MVLVYNNEGKTIGIFRAIYNYSLMAFQNTVFQRFQIQGLAILLSCDELFAYNKYDDQSKHSFGRNLGK